MPITWRANFCARKFISFVAFEHEKMPNEVVASWSRACENRSATRSRAASQEAGRSWLAVAYERRGEATCGHGHPRLLPTLTRSIYPGPPAACSRQGSARRLRAGSAAGVSASARIASGTSSTSLLTPRSDRSPHATRRSSSGSSQRG